HGSAPRVPKTPRWGPLPMWREPRWVKFAGPRSAHAPRAEVLGDPLRGLGERDGVDPPADAVDGPRELSGVARPGRLDLVGDHREVGPDDGPVARDLVRGRDAGQCVARRGEPLDESLGVVDAQVDLRLRGRT